VRLGNRLNEKIRISHTIYLYTGYQPKVFFFCKK
jgi:hypothetical protein